MDRIILHCDCNCFYASCELLSHPDLRQLPVAVCGDPTERHGIILAKNEPAKRCGVKTAETIYKARQKCPGLILLPPHHQLYDEYSKKINAVYSEYTDLVTCPNRRSCVRRSVPYCGGVQVGIKNSRFQIFSRQTTLDHSTHLMREINDTALRLIKELWKAR